MMYQLISLLGLGVLIAIAWALSENRKRISWRLTAWGTALQFLFGLVILKTPLHQAFFNAMRAAVDGLTNATLEGARFVFGTLPDSFDIGAIFAFRVLPVIIFVSALSAMLYHLRLIQTVVYGIAWLMRRTLKTSGAETFAAGLLIFVGIEAAAAIRHYLPRMTRSELCAVMTTFLATIAGSVMVVYAGFGAEPGHLLAASLMSAPAALVLAKMLVPETETPETSGHERIKLEVNTHNIFDAATRGTADGLNLALNVGAIVIVFIALIYLLDKGCQGLFHIEFTAIMSYVFYPFAILLGAPAADWPVLSSLLATKTVFNEFIAYQNLQGVLAANEISPRGKMLATYALCGFANPGSIGIMIAGLASLAPECRAGVTGLVWRAFIGGTLACFMTACVAGALLYA